MLEVPLTQYLGLKTCSVIVITASFPACTSFPGILRSCKVISTKSMSAPGKLGLSCFHTGLKAPSNHNVINMVMALDLFRFFQFLKASSYTLAFQSPKPQQGCLSHLGGLIQDFRQVVLEVLNCIMIGLLETGR